MACLPLDGVDPEEPSCFATQAIEMNKLNLFTTTPVPVTALLSDCKAGRVHDPFVLL